MIQWRSGRVTQLCARWPGAVEALVELDAPLRPGGDLLAPALAYPELVGEPEPGDRVLLNTTGLAMDPDVDARALIVVLPDRLPPDSPPEPGHLVKARYTPSQATVLGVDEQESPHHELIAAAQGIGGMPVVVADLHSALPAVVAGIRDRDPELRIAYVLTDGGALPIWCSRTVAGLRDRLCGTVSTGQSLGGDLEAATVHTGLLAARHVLRADIAVVSQGPGNLGTGTPWGFSGVTAGEVVNAVAALGGFPVGALRISDADPRERHRGVSHHSLTAFGRVALASADLVVPAELAGMVRVQLAPLADRHWIVEVDTEGLDDALRASPVPLSTMGRGLDEDYAYFLASAAAGRHAAALARP